MLLLMPKGLSKQFAPRNIKHFHPIVDNKTFYLCKSNDLFISLRELKALPS